MRLTTSQLIVFACVALVVIYGALLFTCIAPGLQSCNTPAAKITAKLSFWGVSENAKGYEPAFQEFKKTYPGVEITYRGFPSVSQYESALLDALASGNSPDLFMLSHRGTRKWLNKITPIPQALFTPAMLRASFPQVVEHDFISQGQIIALPLSIDTLALYYNRDLLDQSALTVPTTWTELTRAVPRLTLTDASRVLRRSAIALGGTEESVANASDILTLLMMQNGVPMTNPEGTQASFSTSQGADALRFYTQFADTRTESYTWNEGMRSREDFAGEKVAMVLDYASAEASLIKKNAFLNFDIAPVPQVESANKPLSVANYWGYTVSRTSVNPSLAWEFIRMMTTNTQVADASFAITKNPPALRALIAKHLNDPHTGVFARQALIARSWLQPSAESVAETFSRVIGLVISNQSNPSDALSHAAQTITSLLTQ